MLKSYLKLAVRGLWKNKGFSAINIMGLAVGLATCLLIMLYVVDELNFDRYNVHAERIYRIDNQMKWGDIAFDVAQSGPIMGPTFAREFHQVEHYVRFRNQGGFLVKKGNNTFKEEKVIYADSTLFDVFTLPMISGDPRTALQQPHSIVITETVARKYFNTTNIVGQYLVINGNTNYTITGVIKDVPLQSHFNYDFFVSMSGLSESRGDTWISQNFNTYLLLKKGVNVKQLEAQFNESLAHHAEPDLKSALNLNIAELKSGGGYISCSLLPLLKIHLHANKMGELAANGNIQYVYIFSAIAIFIILIACVNFMNLSTARSTNRAKEVGVRKVLGSDRKKLVAQFLGESLFISFISLIVAIIISWILLPFFNQLSQKETTVRMLFSPYFMFYGLLLVIVVGLLAGSYPAFYLSAFNPVVVLKGKLAKGFKNSLLRNAMVVFQFAVSIILIIGTLVIYNQLTYIRNKDLGFNKEQLLVIQNTGVLKEQARAFKNVLSQIPGIQNITLTGFLPVNGFRSNDVFFSDASLDVKKSVSMQKWSVDENYIPTLQLKLIDGRNFSPQLASDSSGFIINEAAAKLIGKGDPIGKQIFEIDDFKTKKISVYHVIGVIKNFHFNSLREQVTPLALRLRGEPGSMALRVSTENIPFLLTQIKDRWTSMVPFQPFIYSFMDEEFNNQYLAEKRIGKIAISFSVLAILVACLGLFGLVTYAAEQRVKEIGIRKILGADITSIIRLLCTDFVRLVCFAIVIASPIAYLAMTQWLQHFAYRIDLSWWIFIEAGLAGLFIALGTISFQAVKAALDNPVKSLRTE